MRTSDSRGDYMAKKMHEKTKKYFDLLNLLRERGAMMPKDIEKELNISTSTFHDCLAKNLLTWKEIKRLPEPDCRYAMPNFELIEEKIIEYWKEHKYFDKFEKDGGFVLENDFQVVAWEKRLDETSPEFKAARINLIKRFRLIPFEWSPHATDSKSS